jgi:hypothetical protein
MSTHTLSFPGADINTTQLTVGTGGLVVDTETLVVNASTNRVGIGSATPTSSLDVAGAVTLSDTLAVAGDGTFSSDTDSTSTTTGALTVAGGVGVSGDIYASNVYITGGLILHKTTQGAIRKSYSYTNSLPENATVAQGTLGIVFTNHVFHAKITALIVEGLTTVSTISLDCVGGHLAGGTPPAITLGETTISGQSACPWSSVVTVGTNTVTIKLAEDVVGAGNYGIFIDYFGSVSSGGVEKITEGGADEITFNY